MGVQLWTGLTSYRLNRSGVDTSEKIGTFLCKPIRIIAGEEYKVRPGRFTKRKKPSLLTRIGTLFISILLSLVTVPGTVIGYGLLKYSTSYQSCLQIHQTKIDEAADKALKKNRPESPYSQPLNLEEVEKIAKESKYFGGQSFGINNLVIFKQTQEASEEEIPAIMRGAIASKDPNKVIAVVVAILKPLSTAVISDKKVLDYMNKLYAAMDALSATKGSLEKVIIDRKTIKGDDKQLQLKFIEDQQLDLILRYKDVLKLSRPLISKIEDLIAYAKQLKEETKDEPQVFI